MYKRLLVPIDLSEAESWQQSLPKAVELAQQSQGRIIVMNVLTDMSAFLEGATLPVSYTRLHTRNEKTLKALADSNIPEDIPVQTVVGSGSIHREIVRTARVEQVDLILMTSHRPGIRDYLLGPNAAHVVRHAPCSVLIIRESAVDHEQSNS
jgi:nucleotide-binding universal stress UspA family protein